MGGFKARQYIKEVTEACTALEKGDDLSFLWEEESNKEVLTRLSRQLFKASLVANETLLNDMKRSTKHFADVYLSEGPVDEERLRTLAWRAGEVYASTFSKYHALEYPMTDRDDLSYQDKMRLDKKDKRVVSLMSLSTRSFTEDTAKMFTLASIQLSNVSSLLIEKGTKEYFTADEYINFVKTAFEKSHQITQLLRNSYIAPSFSQTVPSPTVSTVSEYQDPAE
jgi:hypothetical protein